jgi:phosphoglycerate kinase
MTMRLPVLEDLGDVRGLKILVRADLNVPLLGEGAERRVADQFRIEATVPTLTWLLERGAVVTVCSHLGRPTPETLSELSMAPVRALIQETFGEVEVLENLRFDPGEVANDRSFAEALATGFDAVVLDAFGASHRNHASIVTLPSLLPSVAGRNLELEVEALSKLLDHPDSPYVAVVGGAKVSDKLALLRSLVGKVDAVLVGGAMAFTFLLAQGIEVGSSLVEPELQEECTALLESGKILLPRDFQTLAADESFGPGDHVGEVVLSEGSVPPHYRGLDIGPETVELFSSELLGAKTILWNGPMGVYEDPRFSMGTLGIARAVADSSAYSVVGGGDSAAALRQEGLEDTVSHLSTGGGASLEFLEENGHLVGIDALLEGRRR